jgi:hypothetical protein
MKKYAFEATVIIICLTVMAVCLLTSCVQHELKYDYYLSEPNSLHVESLRYKQNVFAMKTDKLMTEAAFADIITLKMDRSVQVPDPNTTSAITEGVVKSVIGVGL